MSIRRNFLGKRIRMVLLKPTALYLFTFIIFALFTLIFKKPDPTSSRKLRKFQTSLPNLSKVSPSNLISSLRSSIHSPAISKHRTNDAVSWYSNWNFLSLLSSSVPPSEQYSFIRPLSDRPLIHTYYDHTLSKDEADVKEAESIILLTWKRAWWAQGFKPIILSSVEARNNPLSAQFQMKDLDVTLKDQISRWLAWESMGSGILCDYTLLPMGAYQDPLLVYLRLSNYSKLTRFENLGSGLFVGSKSHITAALRQALANEDLKHAKDFISALAPDTFLVEPKNSALAYYNSKTISEKYSKISDKINGQGAKGLNILNQLINSHLHSTWQHIFYKGIAVLKPLPKHMTILVEPALNLAKFLSTCSESPLPSSCPPNLPKCTPCVASQPLRISTPSTYTNISSVYTIGTVSHPYTNAILSFPDHNIDITWIRRVSERDVWVSALTKDILGTGVSGPPRVNRLKEAIASEYGVSCSLWFTSEHGIPGDLDWYFGFTIPSNLISDGKSETPVPGPERRPKKDPDPRDGPIATEYELQREREMFNKVKKWGEDKISEEQETILKAIEAWNLADYEAWRFTKDFSAWINIHRSKLEKEEKKIYRR